MTTNRDVVYLGALRTSAEEDLPTEARIINRKYDNKN